MSNNFYTASGYPATFAPGASASARAEFAAIMAGFDKLPALGTPLALIRQNAAGTGLESTTSIDGIALGVTTPAAGTFTNLTVGGNTVLGDAAGDALTINANAAAIPNGINFSGGNVGIGGAASRKLGVTGGSFTGAGFQGQGIGDSAAERLLLGYFDDSSVVFPTGLVPAQILQGVSTLNIASRDNTSGAIVFRTGVGVVERMRIDAVGGVKFAGDLGVGFTPAAIAGYSQLTLDNTSGSAINLRANAVDVFQALAQAGSARLIAKGAATVMTLETNGAERMRIDAIGNVGIGAAPGAGISLDVTAPAGAPGRGAIRGAAGQAAYLSIAGNALAPGVASFDLQQDNGGNVDIVQRSNARMSLYTNATERLRIAATGGISLTAPSGGTQLAGTSGVSGTQLLFTNTNAANASSILQLANDVGTLAVLSVDGSATAGYGARSPGGAYVYTSAPAGLCFMNDNAAGAIKFASGGNSLRMQITAAGAIQDGNGNELGFKGLPVLVVAGGTIGDNSNRGKCYVTSAGLTINNSALAAGDAISIYNNSAAAITITQGAGLTLRLAGSATTGNRTLATRGIMTVYAINAGEYICSGAGLT